MRQHKGSGCARGRGEFNEIAWANLIAGEPDQEIHRNLPIKRVSAKRKAGETCECKFATPQAANDDSVN
jgi:hypothetical protein